MALEVGAQGGDEEEEEDDSNGTGEVAGDVGAVVSLVVGKDLRPGVFAVRRARGAEERVRQQDGEGDAGERGKAPQ